MLRSGLWQQQKGSNSLGCRCSAWWITHDLGSFYPGYKITTSRLMIITPVKWQRHAICWITKSETPIRCSTSITHKRWIYPNNMEGVEAMGIKTRTVGGAKKRTHQYWKAFAEWGWSFRVRRCNVLSFININNKQDVLYYHDEYIFVVLKPMHEVLFNPRVGGGLIPWHVGTGRGTSKNCPVNTWKVSCVGRSPEQIWPGIPWPSLGTHQRQTKRIWYVQTWLPTFL